MENVYELMLILDPKTEEADEKKILEKVKKNINDSGTLLEEKKLGKKALAYPIRKVGEGIYWVLTAKLSAASVRTFSSKLDGETSIIRYLLVRKD